MAQGNIVAVKAKGNPNFTRSLASFKSKFHVPIFPIRKQNYCSLPELWGLKCQNLVELVVAVHVMLTVGSLKRDPLNP